MDNRINGKKLIKMQNQMQVRLNEIEEEIRKKIACGEPGDREEYDSYPESARRLLKKCDELAVPMEIFKPALHLASHLRRALEELFELENLLKNERDRDR